PRHSVTVPHVRTHTSTADATTTLTTTSSPIATAAAVSAATGECSPVMNWPLVDVHMGLLPNGNLMMWDAWETGGTQSARLFDPISQTFTNIPNPSSQMFCAAQVVLSDGRLFVAGGHNGGDIGIVN